MKNKVYCYLPITATALFSIDKPSNWDEITQEEKEEFFLSTTTLSCQASLGACCSREINTDFEIDWNSVESETSLDLWVKDESGKQ